MRSLRQRTAPSTGRRLFSSLGIRIGFAVLVGVASLATFLVWYSTSRLAQAEGETGASSVLAIARTFAAHSGQAELLQHPELLNRELRRLQAANPRVRRASVYAVLRRHPIRIASTEPGNALAEPHDIEPLRTGAFDYKDEQEDGLHLAELNFPLVEQGRPFAVLGLYYDLSPLDRLHAKRRRELMVAAGSTAMLLTVLLSVVLRLGVFRPLHLLRLATQRISEGELDARLGWSRNDELGAVASDFDAMASKLERSYGQLERLALEDSLTGLLNHRSVTERLAAELARAHREGYTVSLVTMDIDQFKDVNDQLGHAAGDAALRGFAEAIRACVRPSDICGRVGGDEFTIVLPHADGAGAEQVVGRIRLAVQDVAVGATGERITISAGIAEFPRDASDASELSRLADGALYRAKRGGRNHAARYSPTTPDLFTLHEAPDQIQATGLLQTIFSLARAVDAKDEYAHLHSTRVGRYAQTIAKSMGLSDREAQLVRTAGILHDIGKIGSPDSLLLKPGPLTEDEFVEMQRHSELGRDLIRGAGMPEIAEWVASVHEKVDGTGYPQRLSGAQIPLESRILAVADAFEVMTSPRLYRQPRSLADAMLELERGAGTQFDPGVVRHTLQLIRAGRIGLSLNAPIAA